MNIEKKKAGRPINYKMCEKVREYRDVKGLSFRDIEKLLGHDLKTIYRWYRIPLAKVKKAKKKASCPLA